MKKLNNKGFSLVELIIVIAIMVVLIGLLAPQFIKWVEKSRQATDIQNLDSVVTVVQAYMADQDAAEITITGASTGWTVTGTPTSFNLADYGISTGTKGNWSTAIGASIAKADGKVTYAGESDYYKANGSTFDAK